MNNPNPNYNDGPAADPEADFDYQAFIDHVFDALTVRETQIRRWFEAKNFVDVRVRPLPLRGLGSWECLMLRAENDVSPTQDAVQALVGQLAEDMGCQVEPDEFCAVVWSDRICAHFRLSPQPV
ncbi:MAG: hypothetical protein ACLQU3_13825 [Limisphaerales bacterium]